MPRIYDSASNPWDFCADCFPDEDTALELLGNKGDGPDGRGNCFGYDAEHPDYEAEGYRCDHCGNPLEEKDN